MSKTSKASANSIPDLKKECESNLDALQALTEVHLAIVPSTRLPDDAPDWMRRLVKVCLHAFAITRWNIDEYVVHIMAPELRAAYLQMHEVWKHMPEDPQMDEMYNTWWRDEAMNSMLATYDHPTPQSVVRSAAYGGFGNYGGDTSLLNLSVWLGRLGLGYSFALVHLAKELGSELDVESRIDGILELQRRQLLHQTGQQPWP